MKRFQLLLIFICLTICSSIAQIQIGQDIDGEAIEDYSGKSVSLSQNGTRIVIGATGNDANGTYTGHVRIFEIIGGVWIQIGNDIDGEAQYDESGGSVYISADGTRVAIGAYRNDGVNGNNSGHVRIFEENGGVWVQIGNDIDGEAASDSFGTSVSLSSDGKRVAIGAPSNGGNGGQSGHVRIFEENGGGWIQIGNDIDGEVWLDRSGTSVSISLDGERVAIGAVDNDGNGSNSGHVRIFEEMAGGWIQIGNDIDGETLDNKYGTSVSLSSDGKRVAIGAPYNDGAGANSGHVRIFEEIAGGWIQIGNDIDGEASLDISGFSVSLSSNGKLVAIGASRNDENGSNSGHVRIFEEIGGGWTQFRVEG